jgi:peptidoglycan-associated lipoprotein
MSRRAVLVFGLFLLLILSGCAKKSSGPNPNLNHDYDGPSGTDSTSTSNGAINPNEVASNTTTTVTIDENKYNSQQQQALNGSTDAFNSSSDGMKSIYFDFGGYVITSKMQNTIGFNKNVLTQTLGNGKVKLEGNCDEFGTDEYNYALGLKRTKVVKDVLVAQGIPADKIILVSFGESNPQCHEASDDCYARNRRVDLHLIR